MSLPPGGGDTSSPSQSGPPCPSGDIPKEGSRDIRAKGKIVSVPYDWCKSQDAPVPYRIWAWQSDASDLANTVRQADCRSHVRGSIVNQCYGDEPGTGGGVKSQTHNAECTPLTYSPTVRAEGRPMVRYLDKWHMNHKNTWGCLQNAEDTGHYGLPKVKLIQPKMAAIPNREDDERAAADGTKVAQALPMEAEPFREIETPEEASERWHREVSEPGDPEYRQPANDNEKVDETEPLNDDTLAAHQLPRKA